MGITLRSLVLASLVCAASFARAGFTSVAYLDGSYDATQPLANGTVYFVTNSVTFEGAYDGKSGLAVAPGAEVVIFVQEDCRLYARGKDGETGGMGGGAGIGGAGGSRYLAETEPIPAPPPVPPAPVPGPAPVPNVPAV